MFNCDYERLEAEKQAQHKRKEAPNESKPSPKKQAIETPKKEEIVSTFNTPLSMEMDETPIFNGAGNYPSQRDKPLVQSHKEKGVFDVNTNP